MAKAKKNQMRSLLWLLPLCSAYVAWGMVNDLDFHSRHFMQSNKPLTISKRIDDSVRQVASGHKKEPAIRYMPLNPQNYSKITGTWQIYNFINTRDEDEAVDIKVKLELIGNGQIKLDNDEQQIFWISFYSEQETIAIFKKLRNGFEILEARKIHEGKVTVAAVKSEDQQQASPQEKKGLILNDVELVLEKALLPSVTNVILEGDAVSGKATIREGVLQYVDVRVSANGQSYSIEIPFAEINDGGQFTADLEGQSVSGILTNNGQNAFRIRFATGPMAGAILNFITQGEFEKQQDLRENAPQPQATENVADDRVDNAQEMVRAKVEEQERAAEERESQNTKIEAAPAQPDEVTTETVTPEEMAEKIQASGFDFGVKAARDIASK
ncbi:MAG: hypothetical protein A2X86_04815 [Bdellovibrionales bacterium GWA2_49_15]|nr:MAG: hypothetical protein A2X86_04815 [Bdellovibrionales bacterium GWA2_49_15]